MKLRIYCGVFYCRKTATLASMKKHLPSLRIATLGVCLFMMSSCNRKFRVWVGKDSQKIYNLQYGDHKRQKMDVFLPAEYPADAPVVLMLHGGAWKYGKKEHMIHIQKMLFAHNIPTVNMNYRLASKDINYKNQLEDIAEAIRKFNALAGKAELLPDNYILLGESAGGHLALLYGYRHPEQVKKIISLSGPTDFYSENFLKSFYSKYTSGTVQTMVGVKLDRKNPAFDFQEASPISQVSNVPTLFFQGNKDFLVNYRQALSLDSVLTEKNIPHKFIFMENTGHTPRFFNKTKRDSIIYPNILEWIKK